MNLDPLVLAGVATFASVFIKGIQHRNITGSHYRLVFLTSYLIAITDVLMVGLIVKNGWAIVFPSATGAACGLTLSIYLHDRYVNTKERKEKI